MAIETLTVRQLNRATLARQMLLVRESFSVVDAVERLAGMQAQEAKWPFIGLWSRVAGFQNDELRAALHRREIVRATMMRGTLHLLSVGDYSAFRAIFEPMLAKAQRTILGERVHGIDTEGILDAARAVLAERPHTFTELRARLLVSFPDVDERALGFTVRMLMPLVMFPVDHRWAFPGDAAFTLAETWMGAAHDPVGAIELLVSRYLAAFGPATAADFQSWSGLQGAKTIFTEMRAELRVFRDEKGRELFDVLDGPLPDENTVVPPRFLPEFDNLVLAHSDRTRVIADIHKKWLVTKNGRVRATFLWDGFVRGMWEIERKRDRATLVVTADELVGGEARAALTAEGEKLLRFVEPESQDFDVVWQDLPL